jgi:hypothetical protein
MEGACMQHVIVQLKNDRTWCELWDTTSYNLWTTWGFVKMIPTPSNLFLLQKQEHQKLNSKYQAQS